MKYRILLILALVIGLLVLIFLYFNNQTHTQGNITWQSCYLPKYHQWFTAPPSFQLQCTSIQVPLDHNRPQGEKITIALTRLPAKSKTPIGELLLVAGGPGQHSLDMIQWLGQEPSAAALNEHFHVIGFAQRGIAPSSAISCGTLTHEDNPKDYVNACIQHSGLKFLKHISTKHTVTDLEIVRQNLGIETWSMLGYSYGTKIIANYAQHYPKHLRAGVLDGVVNTDETYFEILINQQKQAQEIFGLFMQSCVATEHCPFGVTPNHNANTYDQAFISTLKHIENQKLTDKDGEPITADTLLSVIDENLNDEYFWSSMYAMIGELKTGNTDSYNESITLFDDEAFSDDALIAINCADSTPANRNKDYYIAQSKKVDDAASYNNLSTEYNDDEYLDACFYWPFDGDDDIDPEGHLIGKHTPNLLFVTQTYDLATPFENADTMAAKFDDTIIYTQSIGHALSLSSRNLCMDNLVISYLLNPDKVQKDTECPSTHTDDNTLSFK